MSIEEIKTYVDNLNLNDYDLGGVEITEEDLQEIKTSIDAGKTIKEAVDDCLYGIREILDAGIDDAEE